MAARPRGVTALGIFFLMGAAIAAAAAVALAFPGSALEWMWSLKPEARESLGRMGGAAVLLMASVAAACAAAAIGLFRRARWGRWLATLVLAVNLVGDVLNAILRHDARLWIGVPIALLLLAYLQSRGVRRHLAA